jgi:hypothetical protein
VCGHRCVSETCVCLRIRGTLILSGKNEELSDKATFSIKETKSRKAVYISNI